MGDEDGEYGVEFSQEIEKKSTKRVTSARLHARIKNNECRCELSGVEMSPEDASLDHRIPLSRGGTHDMDNVAVVHKVMNRMKGTMMDSEFVAWCMKVADWNRQKTNKKRHMQRDSTDKTLQKRRLFE